MGTPKFNHFSLSEWIADYYFDDINKVPKQEPIDRNVRHVHTKFDDRPVYNILSGFVKLPLTGMFMDHFCSVQGSVCADIEYRMANCLEAYGLPMSYQKCQYYVDDYLECVTQKKQIQRVIEMRRERNRQYKAGEREFKYAPPPKIWSYEY